jgi:nitroreductase
MSHSATTRFPLHELLRERWSPLAFSDRPVASDVLGSLLEAARWAPSCYNEQPWALLFAQRSEPAEFERLASCLVDANRVWAGRAPVLGIAVAKLNFDRTGQPNAHAWYDLGQAMALLSVQAVALGLCVHQMAGFDPQRAREACAIPATHVAATMFALGYYGKPADLPDNLRAREAAARARKRLDTFVFAGRWGVVPPLAAH